jgi:hypothetical protein
MQYFSNPANGFAADFGDIADYARGVERLMKHWQATTGLSVLTLDYEEFVAHPEPSLAAVRAFVGLPDAAPGEADDQSTRRTIATASAWQARQPIHSGSVERWRHYAEWLPELAAAVPDPLERA